MATELVAHVQMTPPGYLRFCTCKRSGHLSWLSFLNLTLQPHLSNQPPQNHLKIAEKVKTKTTFVGKGQGQLQQHASALFVGGGLETGRYAPVNGRQNVKHLSTKKRNRKHHPNTTWLIISQD